MFNMGFGELVIILLVAFIIVGPADLPKVARAIARLYKKAMRLWKEIMAAINLDEEVEEITKTKKEIDSAVKDINPFNIVKEEVDSVKKSVQMTKKEVNTQLHK